MGSTAVGVGSLGVLVGCASRVGVLVDEAVAVGSTASSVFEGSNVGPGRRISELDFAEVGEVFSFFLPKSEVDVGLADIDAAIASEGFALLAMGGEPGLELPGLNHQIVKAKDRQINSSSRGAR